MMTRSDTTDFIVVGRGEFPLDMLRYDECFPASNEAVAAIAEPRERREVRLRTERSSNVTPSRWLSFNWKVIFIDSERYGVTLNEKEAADA